MCGANIIWMGMYFINYTLGLYSFIKCVCHDYYEKGIVLNTPCSHRFRAREKSIFVFTILKLLMAQNAYQLSITS